MGIEKYVVMQLFQLIIFLFVKFSVVWSGDFK